MKHADSRDIPDIRRSKWDWEFHFGMLRPASKMVARQVQRPQSEPYCHDHLQSRQLKAWGTVLTRKEDEAVVPASM